MEVKEKPAHKSPGASGGKYPTINGGLFVMFAFLAALIFTISSSSSDGHREQYSEHSSTAVLICRSRMFRFKHVKLLDDDCVLASGVNELTVNK